MSEPVKLWSWHFPGFSLTSRTVNHSKSEFYKQYKDAYDELISRIGTDQIVWCATVLGRYADGWARSGRTRKWILLVPQSLLLCCIDEYAWSRIRGESLTAPIETIWKWEQDAREQFPDNPKARDEYVKARKHEFTHRDPPGGSWWDHLFVEYRADEVTTAIIPHPVSHDHVCSFPERYGDMTTGR